MRPLTEEEARQAPLLARQFWRVLLFRMLGLSGVAVGLLAWWAARGDAAESLLVKVFLGVVLLPLIPGAAAFIWAYRGWKGALAKDLSDAVVEQKSGKVYDKFRPGLLIRPKNFTLWVEGTGMPQSLWLDPDKAKGINIGDTIAVEFLPQTGLVLGVQREQKTSS